MGLIDALVEKKVWIYRSLGVIEIKYQRKAFDHTLENNQPRCKNRELTSHPLMPGNGIRMKIVDFKLLTHQFCFWFNFLFSVFCSFLSEFIRCQQPLIENYIKSFDRLKMILMLQEARASFVDTAIYIHIWYMTYWRCGGLSNKLIPIPIPIPIE